MGFGEAEVWKGSPVPFYSAPAGWPHLEAMLEAATRLRLFINPGAGVQHIVPLFRKLGREVVLVNGHGNTYFTAQHAVGLLLAQLVLIALVRSPFSGGTGADASRPLLPSLEAFTPARVEIRLWCNQPNGGWVRRSPASQHRRGVAGAVRIDDDEFASVGE